MSETIVLFQRHSANTDFDRRFGRLDGVRTMPLFGCANRLRGTKPSRIVVYEVALPSLDEYDEIQGAARFANAIGASFERFVTDFAELKRMLAEPEEPRGEVGR